VAIYGRHRLDGEKIRTGVRAAQEEERSTELNKMAGALPLRPFLELFAWNRLRGLA
jgi:hypothetical protein